MPAPALISSRIISVLSLRITGGEMENGFFLRCGLAADLSFVIDFYGLTLFAAGGLNNGGVNDGGGCFLYF